ncbi:MAG: hypothetical protein K0U31_07040, partial [Actinomycetia bacterium]|nr:hypothetical protein [Actinomycetes bacterium]
PTGNPEAHFRGHARPTAISEGHTTFNTLVSFFVGYWNWYLVIKNGAATRLSATAPRTLPQLDSNQ